MTKYFKVLFDDVGIHGVAYVLDKKKDLFCLPYFGPVADWQPRALELREGECADYLANDLGCRLCSERLKNILDSEASPSDVLQWLPAEVRCAGITHKYWILHFPSPPDVLDKNRTKFADRFVVMPVLSKEAVADHRVFIYPEAGEHRMFVAEPVKRIIDASGCTGMEFSRAPTA